VVSLELALGQFFKLEARHSELVSESFLFKRCWNKFSM